MFGRLLLVALLFIVGLPALAQEVAVAPRHEWPFEQSDLPPDPAYRFGRLENGMRYIIRPNATPKGTGVVQFWVDAGSIAETDDELGYAHFIEHMAFNGSTNVPEGEMVRLLAREGLAFGADANASTDFGVTSYRLDLPRNDPALLDTALMLMREAASELTFDAGAVDREKGVILSERRVRDTYQLRNVVKGLEFQYPGARFTRRLPIGTVETLQAATPDKLRELYQRIYRPENTAVIVIGDFDADAVEAAVRKHFDGWEAQPLMPATPPGPVPFDHAGQTDIYLDPALAEQITVSRHGPWIERTDNRAFREANVRRQLGYGIINRRLQRIARQENPPFRGASLDTSDVFEDGRTTSLTVSAGDGEWQRALAAAQAEYRRAMEQGFTEAEVAEQIANLRTALESNAAGADTRSHGAFMTGALTLLQDGQIPTTPASALQRFVEHLPQITPETVLESLKQELVPLDNPLIRFEGRTAPEGGAAALRAAWDEGMAATLSTDQAADLGAWTYTDFGPAGEVVIDTIEPRLGIRKLVFANGLKLNLKRTDLQQDRVTVQLHVDGGQMLNTRDNPLAMALASYLPVGGLGQYTSDELQTVLAGHSVGLSVATAERSLSLSSNTTPRDLELQLQLFAAALTDPGFRPQGEAQFRRNIDNFYARLTATPETTLSNALGGIISDGDPRFTLQPKDTYLALNFAKLRDVVGDRLANGALELALVGDIDEAQAIELVAKTLGALPSREAEFRDYAENRHRTFTANRAPRTLRHDGPADQAIVRMDWPTTDNSNLGDVLRLELLKRVLQIELTETLREKLGQTYSPGVNASQSDTYAKFGYFTLAAQVAADQVGATREAMLETVRTIIAQPIDDDVLLRARRPVLEAYDNALKTNGGWMALVSRAQSDPDDIDRYLDGKAGFEALTATDVQATAARYLRPDERLEIVVLPRGE
jgi:zinc protease